MSSPVALGNRRPGNPVLSLGLCKGIALARESEKGTVRELAVRKERAVWSWAGTQRGFYLLDVFLKKVPQYLHQVGESWSLLGIAMPAAQHYTVTAKKRCWFYATETPSYCTQQLLPMWCPLGQHVPAPWRRAQHPPAHWPHGPTERGVDSLCTEYNSAQGANLDTSDTLRSRKAHCPPTDPSQCGYARVPR